jgi:predicted aspartyl protease
MLISPLVKWILGGEERSNIAMLPIRKTGISKALVTLILAVAVFIFASANLTAQEKRRSPRKPIPNARFANGQPVLNIPFDFKNHQIVLSVSVDNSAPMKFMFDTGAGVTVLNKSMTGSLKLKKIDTVKVNGVVAGMLAGGVTLSVPGVTVRNQRVVVMALDEFPCEFRDVVGVIGYDFIKEFVVEIDYEARTLSLFDPSTYQYAARGDVFPLTITDTPRIHARVTLPGGKPIEGFFEIDTGSDSALAIHSSLVKRHNMLANSGTQLASTNTRVQGELKAVDVRLDNFQLGRSIIAAPIVSLLPDEETDNDGPIGNEILRRFKVTIDYSRQRMILEPNSHISDSFEMDMSGIMFESSGKDCRVFKVVGVTEKSPAEESGILIGDEIVAIDDKPANQFSSVQIERVLMNSGEQHSVTVRREGQERVFKITLRRSL